MFTTESKRAKKYNNKNNGEAMREIKITSGKLRSMIKEYVSDQKINKLKGVSESHGSNVFKKVNEAASGVNLEQPYSNLYIKGWGLDANGNMRIIIGLPNDRGYSIQTNGALPNTHNLIRGKSKLTDEDLKVIGKEITDYVRLETSKESILHSRLKLKGVSESQKPSRNNIADYNQHRIAVDTVKNPNKSMFGGPNVKESEDILRNKFGYTDQEINKLKGVSESSRISESPMSDVEKIKGIVQTHVDSGGSLIGLGTELKKAGYKSEFSTEPLAMHMIKIDGDTFVITNKKYISDEEKPDFVVGELAGGFM